MIFKNFLNIKNNKIIKKDFQNLFISVKII